MSERNDAQIGDPLRVTPSFIVEEEEEIIPQYRPADTAAELVPGQLGPIDSRLVIEECIRCRQRCACVFAQRPVESVAAAFGYHLNLTAAAAAFGGAGIGRNGSEFLNRVDRSIADCGRKLPGGLVVGVNSVNGDVSLVGSRSGDRAHAIGGSGS